MNSHRMTREEAIRRLEEGAPFSALYDETWESALIMAIDSLKAEPIKHGRWIWNKRLGEWYCSNCDRIMTPYTVEKSEGVYEMAQPFYCGWCGAKMDLDEVENG